MLIRLIGFLLVTGASAAAGLSMASGVRARVHALQGLQTALELAKNEICYQLTPLPELFCKLAEASAGKVRRFFQTAGIALGQRTCRSVPAAFSAAFSVTDWGTEERRVLSDLGAALGRYDLEGQQRALGLAASRVAGLLSQLEADKRARCKSYGMLGICTGLAIAILLV